MTRLDSQKGYTITELLIVIAIVAVLLGVGGLSISEYWNRSTVKETARSIDGDWMTIRTFARMRQQSVLISFTAAGYTAFIDAVPINGTYNVADGDTLVLQRSFRLPVQIQGVAPFIFPATLTMSNFGAIAGETQIVTNITTEPNRLYCIRFFSTGSTRVLWTSTAGAPLPCNDVGPTVWSRAW